MNFVRNKDGTLLKVKNIQDSDDIYLNMNLFILSNEEIQKYFVDYPDIIWFGCLTKKERSNIIDKYYKQNNYLGINEGLEYRDIKYYYEREVLHKNNKIQSKKIPVKYVKKSSTYLTKLLVGFIIYMIWLICILNYFFLIF